MTAKTMPAVLAEHQRWVSYCGPEQECECGVRLVENSDAGMAAHQAAALSAAGFGLVADAKAEAWDEAYKLGVDDERTSQANPGIAGCFCHGTPCQCFVAPARVNPYRAAS